MSDKEKTKEQLIEELQKLRQQVAELQELEKERRQMEEALAHERDLLHALMDNIPDTIYFKDAASRFTRINRAQAQVMGVNDPKEAIGKTDLDFFTAEHARDAHADEQEIVKSGQPVVDKVEKIRRADGQIRWVSATKVPIMDKEGRVTGTVGISRDITERKQAEEELRWLKEFNEGIVQSMTEGIVVEDAEGHFTFVNPAAATMLGYTPDELLGQPWTVVVPADQRPIVQAADERRARGEADRYELQLTRKDGTRVPVLISGSPRFEEGRFSGALAVFTDITKRKRAEEALRVEKAYLEQLFESAPEAIVLVDNNSRVLRANSEFTRTFGYSLDEALGQSIDELLAPDDFREEAVSLTKRVAKGESIALETVRRRKDGTLVNVSVLGTPIKVDGGQVAVYAIYRDITERKRSEEALRKSESLFHSLIESLPQNIFSKDLEGRFTFANQRYCMTEGKSLTDILGKTDFDLHPPELAKKYREDDRRVIETGQVFETVEEHQPMGGERFYVQVVKTPVHDSKGQVMGILGIFWDITERKRAEVEIIQLNRELTTLNRIGQTLISTLDLQETLTIITDHTTRLLDVAAASVILHDEAKGDLRFAAASGKGADFMQSVRLALGQGIAGWVIQHGEPLMVSDVSKDPRWFGDYDKESGFATGSILCVPLQTKGQTIGAIEVINKESGTFDQEDLRLLTSLAAPAATAIETARLYDQAQKEITERKRAQEALQESEKRLRTIVDSLQLGIVVVDAETHAIVDANPIAIETIGAPKEKIIGHVCHKFICPAEAGKCPITDLGQAVDQAERILINANGESIPILKTVTPTILSGREHLIESFIEITERKQAEEALRESEEKYRNLVERANDGIVIVQDTLFKYANQRVAEIIGYTTEELIDTSFTAYIYPDELPKVADRYKRRMAGEEVTPVYETAIKHKDGHKIDVELNAAVTTYQGKPADFVIIRDITERKRAQEEIHRLSQFQESIIDNANIWLDVLDEKGNIVIWNKAAEEISGYSRQEVVGHGKIWEWLYPDEEYRNEVFAEAIATIEKGGEEQDSETTIRCKDGQTRVFSWNSRNLVDEKGNPIGSIALGHDITERKQAEAKLERRAVQLQAAAEVSRATTSILNPEELIRQVVDLVCERFDLYYVGLFLLDEERKFAVLRAATGEAGRKMLEMGYKLEVDGKSMIGWCIANAQARIALDMGKEAVRFDNPLLPETRTEMALPLVSLGQVIGAMTIQSAQAAAFSEEDITVLQTMADQLANAIENARLFEELQQTSFLMGLRVQELACLNDIGRKIEETPPAPEFLQWVAARIPLAMQYQQMCLTAIEFEGQVYGTAEAVSLPRRMVQALRVGDKVAGRVHITYIEDYDFLDEESALLGDIVRRVGGYIQSRRLFEETQIRTEELAVLNELGQALTARLSVEEVLEEAYRQASRLVDTTNFYIGLYDPEKDEITFPLAVDSEQEDWSPIKKGEGLTGRVVETGKPLLLPTGVTGLHQEARGEIQYEEIGKSALSWLGVPLTIGDQVLGVIAVQSYTTPGLYDEHDRDLLTAIASPTAIAIQNARLFEDTKSRLAQLTALQETTRAVASTLELDKLLNLITQQATTLLQGDGGIINLVNWEKKEDEVVTASGSCAHTVGFRSPLEDSLSGWVTLHNQPVISNQLQDDNRADVYVRSGELQGQSAAIAPLTIKDQVIGTLVVTDKQGGKGEFDQADLDLLIAFANQAATAIENARLFEEIQQTSSLMSLRVKELACLNDIGRKIEETPPVPEFLQWVTERIPSAAQYSDVCLAAIEFEGQVYGAAEAVSLPCQMVQALRIGGQVVGWVYIAYTEEHDFLNEESALLGDIVRRVSSYIENQRLIQETQARAERERIIREISDQMQRATDMEALMCITAEGLNQALGGSRTYVRLGTEVELTGGDGAEE